MRVTGYIRISTAKQSNEHWRMLLTEYAQGKGLPAPSWVEDTISGKTPWRDRGLAQILREAERGDILIVGEASRIGRDAADALDFIKECRSVGLIVHIIQAGLIVDGDGADASTIILPVLFGMAEYERKLLSYRTRLGLQKARERGRKLGGPRRKGHRVEDMPDDDRGERNGGRRALPCRDAAIRAVRAGNSISGTAERYGVSRATIHRWLKAAQEDSQPALEPAPAT